MKFMILVKSNPSLEKDIEEMSALEMKESMAKMNAFNEELKKAGVMKGCDGLRLSREGKRVRFDGESRSVVSGPFQGDLVAGYWLWELPQHRGRRCLGEALPESDADAVGDRDSADIGWRQSIQHLRSESLRQNLSQH